MGSDGVLSAVERLRRLDAMTDAALSRLEVPDLLDELLDRVRDLLGADTAAVLLLDPHDQHLSVAAAKGLERDIRGGLRIPVGRGFAGRVAQGGKPLVLTRVTDADVVSSALLASGIRSLLGVPVFAGRDVIGVMLVGARSMRQFTEDDVRFLEVAADRVGAAEQIRSHRLDQAAAMSLQRSLLPPVLPALPGLQVAARYAPGQDFGIGGDWYDLFQLPSGWAGLVIGDVSGHGLASAVVMGRIRSALRAYALISEDPAEVLALLDHKVRHFEAGLLTTAFYAMISPDRTTVHMSSAGHLAPILALPGRPASLVEVPVDAPLGLGRLGARRSTVVCMPPEALLLGYTDGLVERRGEIIDVGIKRLLDIVEPTSPADCVSAIMTSLGGQQTVDDVALIAVQRNAQDLSS